MPAVDYSLELPYRTDESTGRRYPGLALSIRNPHDSDLSLDIEASLDSGAELSLFDGRLLRALGLSLESGPKILLGFVSGSGLPAYVHRIVLEHEALGLFTLRAGFSQQPIHRNILGRDFFDAIQVGFFEYASVVYLKGL